MGKVTSYVYNLRFSGYISLIKNVRGYYYGNIIGMFLKIYYTINKYTINTIYNK